MKFAVAVLLAVGLLSACSNDPAHRRISSGERKVCEGMLEPKLYEDDFLSTWGKPDRTSVVAGEEFTKIDLSLWRGGAFSHSHENYVIWNYELRDLQLVFDKDNQLVTWKTSKTVRELSVPLPDGPITCSRVKAD